VRDAVARVDAGVPLTRVRVFEDYLSKSLARPRFNAFLLSIFAGVALVLTAIGIYGVMAYSVAQRTREIGIRMALGAIPRQILSMVLREASSLSAAAIALGVGASFLATRFVKSMLFGIAPSDPATLWGATALLMFVALAASWIPARRAANVQPMEALRRE
jgi:ABC-type antimicrobial peptide transport system permease subunit